MRHVIVGLMFGSIVEASNLSARNNAMRKVIQLLNDMKTKVVAETAQGKKDAADYADWCIKSITETEADVKYGGQKVEELAAAAEDGSARGAAARADAAECGMAIGKSQKAQSVAGAVRKDEASVFASKESELVEADTMLGKAYSVLKRSLSLMQTGSVNVKQAYVEEIVAAVGQIIESASVDPQSVKKMQSFLEDSESLSMTQPQAISKAYESKSGGILDTIQQMQEKNAEVLNKVRSAEMTARHQHELLMQDLKSTEENKSEQMSAAKETAAKAEVGGKEAEAAGSEASDVLAADKKELSDTKSGCDKAAKEWAAREADAGNEIAVIQQAAEILSGKFGSSDAFMQVRAHGEDENRFQRRQAVSGLLRKLGRQYNQFSMIQAAQAAMDDPFIKVRGMISDMITRLEEEQRKEGDKEAKCKINKEKGAKDLKVKTAYHKKLVSREGGAKAKIVRLGEDIADLNEQLKELSAQVTAATSFRTKEKSDNAAVVKDSAEAIEAISGAIGVLGEYYGTETAFVQTTQPKSDSASVIIEMLQTAQEDFEKLKQETESAEASQQNKYERMMQDSDVAKAKKTALVDGKTNEKAAVNVQLTQISEDLVDAEKALTAASDFLKGVKEACANKTMSFEERQQRREAEIVGLREALDILSSDESFLQTTSEFLAKRA